MSEPETTSLLGDPQNEIVIASVDAQAQVLPSTGHALDEQIRIRAYQLYHERGGRVGDDLSDWLRAESECLSRTAGTGTADPS